MGLETHVDRVLKEAGINRDFYYWRNGLNIEVSPAIETQNVAAKIMKLLDESGEFGPTRYNKGTKKIEFGVFNSFFSGEETEYNQYRKDFKNWLVDAGEKKMEG